MFSGVFETAYVMMSLPCMLMKIQNIYPSLNVLRTGAQLGKTQVIMSIVLYKIMILYPVIDCAVRVPVLCLVSKCSSFLLLFTSE